MVPDDGEAQVSETTCKKCKANTWMVPMAGEGHVTQRLSVMQWRHSGPGLLAEDCDFDYFVVLGPCSSHLLCGCWWVGEG